MAYAPAPRERALVGAPAAPAPDFHIPEDFHEAMGMRQSAWKSVRFLVQVNVECCWRRKCWDHHKSVSVCVTQTSRLDSKKMHLSPENFMRQSPGPGKIKWNEEFVVSRLKDYLNQNWPAHKMIRLMILHGLLGGTRVWLQVYKTVVIFHEAIRLLSKNPSLPGSSSITRFVTQKLFCHLKIHLPWPTF